jgi:hypothetical protein
MSEKPQRKKRSKLKRLNVTAREKWEKILKDVEKREVPVTVLESITVNLFDGTAVDISIKELLAEGYSPDDIEQMLEQKLTALDHIINDVDFYVNIDDVAKLVQPITDNFLKDL